MSYNLKKITRELLILIIKFIYLYFPIPQVIDMMSVPN